MAFGDLINSKHGAIGSGALTINFTAATAGNLLIAVFARSTNSTDGTPSGWTPISGSASGNLDGSWFYKIAAGGEATITSADGASGNATGNVFEFEGPFAASPLDKTASDSSHLSSATKTQSSGTTASTTQAGEFVIAYFAADSGVTMAGTTALTNDFYKMSGDTTTARAYYCIGILVPADIGTYETTFSTSGTGDEMYGAIATFMADSGGTVYEESVTVGTSAGVSDAGNATMNTLETLGTILQNSMFENAEMSASAILSASVLNSINSGITLSQSTILNTNTALAQTNTANMNDTGTLGISNGMDAAGGMNVSDSADIGIGVETNMLNNFTVNENVSVNIENDDYSFGNVDLSDTVMIGTNAALANDNIASMGNDITLAVEDALTSSGGTSFGDSITLNAQTLLDSGTTVTVETVVVVGLNTEINNVDKVDFSITINLGQHISVLNINQVIASDGLAIAVRLAANTAVTTESNVRMKVIFCGMECSIYIGMA